MHHPTMTVALAAARHEDVMRRTRELERQRHHEALAGRRRRGRAAAMSRRLARAVPRGLVTALAPQRS